MVRSFPALYDSRLEVLLSLGQPTAAQAILTPADGSLIPFALAVESRLNAGQPSPLSNSRETTLSALGIREGSRIAVPNYGSQWQTSYPVPSLVIDAVGPTVESVEAQTAAEVERIRATVEAIQSERGVPLAERVGITPLSETQSLREVASTRRTDARAYLAIGLVGLITTAGAWSYLRRRAQQQPV
jgi:hypothetical protein